MSGNTNTYTALGDHFVSFMNPRLLSAGKLALRGVQIDSYPLNMSEVSTFAQVHHQVDTTTDYDDAMPNALGWAPIMVYNPDAVALEYLITMECRVRFSVFNAASASLRHHGYTPDSVWNRMLQDATSMGNAVKDIADIVANTGMAVNAARNAYSIGRTALTSTAPMRAVLPALMG